MNKKIIFPPIYIVGPTASGKSELAIRLAKKYDSIVISADSMQIYKGLDIGTAKVSLEIRQKIPHKLVDIINYDEEFSVANFAKIAKQEIKIAQQDGKLPIIVGGTGLYFEALLYPMSFANTIKNDLLRKELIDDLQKHGAKFLHDKLNNLDTKAAHRLHPNDTKRVIRALEIIITTGKTLDQNSDEREKPNAIMIGLNTDRKKLYERINLRVDKMFEQGLVDEVLSVKNFNYQSMQAIGYKEFKNCTYKIIKNHFIVDSQKLNEIKESIKQHTRNYAKRQLTWFRKYDFVQWFESDDYENAIKYIDKAIKAFQETT